MLCLVCVTRFDENPLVGVIDLGDQPPPENMQELWNQWRKGNPEPSADDEFWEYLQDVHGFKMPNFTVVGIKSGFHS